MRLHSARPLCAPCERRRRRCGAVQEVRSRRERDEGLKGAVEGLGVKIQA